MFQLNNTKLLTFRLTENCFLVQSSTQTKDDTCLAPVVIYKSFKFINRTAEHTFVWRIMELVWPLNEEWNLESQVFDLSKLRTKHV